MRIELKNIAHSYDAPGSGKGTSEPGAAPGAVDPGYALHPLEMTWEDGGAYALLGPSGCGKTTLLNIISGLIKPTRGRILFDGQDFTNRTPGERNIAQMFQFPVVYDSMTVFDNLAFPLRNRRMEKSAIDRRVREIAAVLELESLMNEKALGLSAAQKQIISLGRGLVRQDVAAILLDEPLTVIDPAQKWELRRKLKQIQEAYKITTIYVTHDQLEALTFADQILVMQAGRVLQMGSPQDLFESPAHPFVGFFIGSPGMNFVPALTGDDRTVRIGDVTVFDQNAGMAKLKAGPCLVGIRPEYVQLETENSSAALLAGHVRLVEDRGADQIVTVRLNATENISSPAAPQDVLVLTEPNMAPPAGAPCRLRFPSEHSAVFPGRASDFPGLD